MKLWLYRPGPVPRGYAKWFRKFMDYHKAVNFSDPVAEALLTEYFGRPMPIKILPYPDHPDHVEIRARRYIEVFDDEVILFMLRF